MKTSISVTKQKRIGKMDGKTSSPGQRQIILTDYNARRVAFLAASDQLQDQSVLRLNGYGGICRQFRLGLQQ